MFIAAPLHVTQVRRGCLSIDPDSLGGAKSNRPGTHTMWILLGEEADPKNKKNVWQKSYLVRRGCTTQPVKVLPYAEYLNPSAPLAKSQLGGGAITKGQRRKQWFTGLDFWNEIRESAHQWMNFDSTHGVAYIDLTPWDDKFGGSILHAFKNQTAKKPAQMLVSCIWADMTSQDAENKVSA